MGGDSYLEMAYEQKCQSEVIRQTKGSKIIGIAVSRMCEKRIGMLFSPPVKINPDFMRTDH